MSFKSSSKKQKQKKTFDDLVRVILTTAFREIDVDGDGTLDADELKAVGFSPAAIERFDKNGDGKLSQDEFCDSLFQVVTKKKTDNEEGQKIMSECITLVTRVLKDRHKRDAAALTAASSDQSQKYEELTALRADAEALAAERAALEAERDEAKSDAARLRLEAESLEAAAKTSRAKIAQLMSQDLKAPAPKAAPRAPATTAAAPSLAHRAVSFLFWSALLAGAGAGAALAAAKQRPDVFCGAWEAAAAPICPAAAPPLRIAAPSPPSLSLHKPPSALFFA